MPLKVLKAKLENIEEVYNDFEESVAYVEPVQDPKRDPRVSKLPWDVLEERQERSWQIGNQIDIVVGLLAFGLFITTVIHAVFGDW